jgi:pullulanase/glycogen debranching enzyme
MKFIQFFILLFFCISGWQSASAQIITHTPGFPTQNDSLRIIYDATQGNQGLKDFTGDVYLHTGVITNNSTTGSDWKHVPYDWTTNNARMKAQPLGDNKWAFTYTPTVRSFFGVNNPSETIEQVAIVFKGVKNGAVVAEGKDTGNADIFIDLYENTTSVRFAEPAGINTIMALGDTLQIEGLGHSADDSLTLTLYKDGAEVAATHTDSVLTYTFIPTQVGNVAFEMKAASGSGLSATATHRVIVTDGVEMQARPAGLQDGITYSPDGQSVTLSLFAPQKKSVFVLGDFNDWQPDFNYLMKKDSLKADSVWCWLEITGLTPGQSYGFQYLVDGQLKIADPYSTLILDPYNDSYIPESTFPNLMPYPKEKTTGYVSVIEPGKPAFNWQAENYKRPAKKDLVIYELLVRDFLKNKNYQTLTDTLDYFVKLGVNAIELMPVSEFDGNLSWGYNPSFHLALDKFYGTSEAFKTFIDEAHKRGIAIIMDVVMNHATGSNSFYQLYGNDDAFYFNSQARHASNVFNDFDHSYSGTQYYTKRMINHWINEYKIDGFRWDLTKGFTQNCTANDGGCTGRYQQDRVDILKKYADWQWEADSTFYVIFEHLGSEQEEAQWANYRIDEGKGVLLWGNMNGPYNEATMGYNANSGSNLFGVLAESRSSFQRKSVVGYMESHDEQWMMFKNIAFGNSSGNYDIKKLNTALGRQKLAGAFFFTLPGPKMMWEFGELGYGYGDKGEQCLNDHSYCPPSSPSRTGEKPIRWDYYTKPERLKLYKTWSALIKLRKSSPAFTDPESATYNLNGALKSIVLEHADTDVLIAGNFGVTTDTLDVVYPASGMWYNYFEGTSVDITNPDRSFILAPGEFKVLTTKQFETPEAGILTSIKDNESAGLPLAFDLKQNYPNPFNPTTTLRYEVAKSGKVTLQIFDVLGRKVADLVHAKKAPGSYTVKFDAHNLSSGMYIYRLQAAGVVLTKKMMLIK